MEDFSNRVVDRVPQFDERSRRFSAVAGLEDHSFRSYTWSCDVYNDQGSEGACVGFAWAHELSARPKVVRRYGRFAQEIYERAKEIDPWPGEDYSGTSVLAGIKAIQEKESVSGKPLIQEYRWAFGIQDVLKVVGYRGPVVLGIDWYYDMYFPDPKTKFITPTGTQVGGHAIMANGVKIVGREPDDVYGVGEWSNVDIYKSWVRLHNSWGTGYGDGGDAYITVRDLGVLLSDNGEACIPTIRSFDR